MPGSSAASGAVMHAILVMLLPGEHMLQDLVWLLPDWLAAVLVKQQGGPQGPFIHSFLLLIPMAVGAS
jgi:hypothetical protein